MGNIVEVNYLEIERPVEPAFANDDPEQWCEVACWEEARADEAENRIAELEAEKLELGQMVGQLEVRCMELEEQVPKWISVDDRLPEENQQVLALEFDNYLPANEDLGVATFVDGKFWYDLPSCDYSLSVDNVTHWQPLPDPPQDN